MLHEQDAEASTEPALGETRAQSWREELQEAGCAEATKIILGVEGWGVGGEGSSGGSELVN